MKRSRQLVIFLTTIVLGYALFIAPNVFFGVTKLNGGLRGINLLWIALFQLISIFLLVRFSLRRLRLDWADIGGEFSHWLRDLLLGLGAGLLWTALQFLFLIPHTGGGTRPDVAQMVETLGGNSLGFWSYLALGVLGGGVAEEIFNRGYFIAVLGRLLGNRRSGLCIAAGISIFIFALGHMPDSPLMWLDILVPTVAYTLLFVSTGRLTASIVAHGSYNATAICCVQLLYAG